MATDLFLSLKGETFKRGEDNDCTVIATSVVTGWSYNKSHKVMANEANRKKGQGAYYEIWMKRYMKYHGFEYQEVDLKPIIKKKGSGLTGKTVAQWLPKRGRFIVMMRGHVAAIKAGKLHDWTQDRKNRVLRVYKVRKAA